MKVRTSDGQVFEAWVNAPENERNAPAWLGQIGDVTETRMTITAPDGSTLTIGPGDVVINEHGRLRSVSIRTAQRLFYLEEFESDLGGPKPIPHPQQPENIGRARQGMVTSDRGRLQPDSAVAAELSDQGATGDAAAANDRGAAATEQDGERSGESSGAADPTEATASGGPGDTTEPASGAYGSAGEGEAEATSDDGADGQEEAVTHHRRRGRK